MFNIFDENGRVINFEIEVVKSNPTQWELDNKIEKWVLIVNSEQFGGISHGEWNQKIIIELLETLKCSYIEKMLKEYNGHLFYDLTVYLKTEEDAQKALDWITGQVVMKKLSE